MIINQQFNICLFRFNGENVLIPKKTSTDYHTRICNTKDVTKSPLQVPGLCLATQKSEGATIRLVFVPKNQTVEEWSDFQNSSMIREMFFMKPLARGGCISAIYYKRRPLTGGWALDLLDRGSKKTN